MLREYYSLETEVPLHSLVINDGRDTHDQGPLHTLASNVATPLHTLAINVATPLHTLAINVACCCPREVRGINMPPLPILDGWGEG